MSTTSTSFPGPKQVRRRLRQRRDDEAMLKREHDYGVRVRWTGNLGEGTTSYRGYSRRHTVELPGKLTFEGSADPSFRGDAELANPEELLLAALAECHMLSFLALCPARGVVVTAYSDEATGRMVLTSDGGGHFESVTLHPRVTVTDAAMVERAIELHHPAHDLCFIASSVNFDVSAEPTIEVTVAN